MAEFDPSQPYNDLPELSRPLETIERPKILKKCISEREAS